MAKKSAPPPNSTRSFFLGLIAAAVVVAVALVFVMRRGSQPESGAGSAVDTATQSAPANAPQPAATAMPEPTDEQLAVVRRVTVDDVLKEAPKGVVFIDVRESDSYLASHIDGALHIPTSYLMGEAAYLPKDRLIVSYCT